MNFPYQIILASNSPRRKELLGGLGFNFKIEVYPVDESFDQDINPQEVAEFLAKKKSFAFRDLKQNELVITADTTVVLDGQILGKPKDREEAIHMICELSGKKHEVISGVCLRTIEQHESFSEVTTVEFDDLKLNEIEYYVDHYKPFDKAGAYGIQEWIGQVGITSIQGDYYNVVGLPLHQLYTKLNTIFKP
jgi:septum formation protein